MITYNRHNAYLGEVTSALILLQIHITSANMPIKRALPLMAACNSEQFTLERQETVDHILSWADRLSLHPRHTASIVYDITQLLTTLEEWDNLRDRETSVCFHDKVKKIMDSLQFVSEEVEKWTYRVVPSSSPSSNYFMTQLFNILAWQIGRLTLRGHDTSDTYAIKTAKRLEETEWGYITSGKCRGPAMKLTAENDPSGDNAKLLVFWSRIHIDYIDGCKCPQCRGN